MEYTVGKVIGTAVLSGMTSTVGFTIIKDTSINLIKNTSNLLVSVIHKCRTDQFEEISKSLEELDLPPQLDIIQALLEDLPEKIPKTIHVSVNHVHNLVSIINDEITKINTEIENHKQKWLYWWREAPILLHRIDQLKMHRNHLDRRSEILFKILPLYNLDQKLAIN